MSAHLHPEALHAWLSGELGDAERATLLAHLDAGCEHCHGLLDDDVLARLLAAEAAPPAPPPPFARPVLPEAGREAPRRWPWAVAAAAVLLAGVLVPRVDRLVEKGPAPALTVRLEAAIARPGRPPVTERTLGDGDIVGRDDLLVFQLDVDAPAARYLVVIDGAGVRHPILPPEGEAAPVEPAGPRPATWDGEWLALTLDDLPGPVTLVAVAAPSPVADPLAAPGVPRAELRLEVAP